MTTTDVVVIGGGQAGLAAGYHLRRQNLDFVILDAHRCRGGSCRRSRVRSTPAPHTWSAT